MSEILRCSVLCLLVLGCGKENARRTNDYGDAADKTSTSLIRGACELQPVTCPGEASDGPVVADIRVISTERHDGLFESGEEEKTILHVSNDVPKSDVTAIDAECTTRLYKGQSMGGSSCVITHPKCRGRVPFTSVVGTAPLSLRRDNDMFVVYVHEMRVACYRLGSP